MAGLIILILIGLGGLGYLIILFIGVVISTINAAIKSKKAPPVLMEESKQLFLNSIRTESDYKSDEEFMEYLPSDSDGYNFRNRCAIDVLETDGKMPTAISYVLTTIYCPDECRAAQILIWKMIESNHALYSAMLREEKAAKDWMDKNNKCYYPVSYMVRTFKKYGVTEKLNELAKIGCSIPNDLRPYAPGRKSNESSLIWRRKYQQEKTMEDYKESRAQVTEGLWLISSAVILVVGIVLAVLLYNSMDESWLRNFLTMLLLCSSGVGTWYCAVRAPGAGIKARRDESEDIKDDIYPGL